MTESTTPASAGPRFVPLSKSAHAALRWRRFDDYGFAAGEMLAPIALSEVTRAAAHFPLVIARGADGRHEPAALLGLQHGENLMVGATTRDWAAEYVPAGLRGRPFGLGVTSAGKTLMCIDEQSPLVGPEGEPFFTPEGELTQGVRQVADFLGQLAAAQLAGVKACTALAQHACLEPLTFPPAIVHGLHGMSNLLQVKESALDALPEAALAELRNLGALRIAYAQLVSWHRLPALGRLAAQRAQEQQAAQQFAADLSLLDRDGTLVLGPPG